mmetsp:Transcript_29573/g.77578  ORF Transcript_29573/g.77578 Transcript_29573/m.77578 type:complete len:238 (-) Transcript_29573:83-796(-)
MLTKDAYGIVSHNVKQSRSQREQKLSVLSLVKHRVLKPLKQRVILNKHRIGQGRPREGGVVLRMDRSNNLHLSPFRNVKITTVTAATINATGRLGSTGFTSTGDIPSRSAIVRREPPAQDGMKHCRDNWMRHLVSTPNVDLCVQARNAIHKTPPCFFSLRPHSCHHCQHCNRVRTSSKCLRFNLGVMGGRQGGCNMGHHISVVNIARPTCPWDERPRLGVGQVFPPRNIRERFTPRH